MARVTPARNDPCPCGSGKKFKQCCGQKRAREEPATAADLRLLAGLADSRRFLELESRALEAIGRFPDSGPAWKALSVALRMQGKDALHALQKAAELLPADAEAQCNLGNALRHGGRLDEAVARYRQAIRNEPAYIEARHNLGNAQLALGRFDEAAASYREVLQINPNIAESHSNLGNALLALGRPEEAAASYRRALALNPELASAHSNLGDALRELGQSEQAAASCRRALAIDPNNAQAHNSLGNALLDLGRPADAAACYARALTLDSRFVKACVNLAIALRLLGSTSEADAACRKALEIDPTAAPALALLGELQADRGLFAEAETLFRRAAAIDPRMPEAWAGIAHLRKMTSDDASWLAQALRIADGVSKPREEAYLRYAIGKYCDDVGDYTGAFAQYRRANDLTKAYAPSYDRRRMTQAVDRIVRTCDRQWARMPRSLAMRTPRPVFIVGMPRSGTTLAEQILASHPSAFGAGELAFWTDASAAFDAAAPVGEDAERMAATLGADYLRLLGELSADALRVVDKMPANFMSLALIHDALPHARIIHLRRSPRDTCLSIYFQHFKTNLAYANDLEDLAAYYVEYLRLMEHWRSVLPANILLDVPYEGLVADQESWSRRMIEFIGLPWDVACLDFHRTERRVMTASKWQVRQRISSASVGRWRNYQTSLGPLANLPES